TLQELLGGTNNCTFFMIKTTDGEKNAPAVKAELEKYYPGNYVFLSKDLPAFYSQPIGPLQIFLKVVIGLAIVINTLVIMLTMHTTITERTREIGILKSLGASSRFIISSIEKEAMMISAIGVLFGFLVAVIARKIVEGNTRLLIDISFKWLLISALIGLAA